MMKKQGGFSISDFLKTTVVVVVVIVLAVKLVPPYTEYGAIKRDLTEIVNDPDMADASPSEIRSAFAKKALIDDVKSVSADDIMIDRGPFQLRVKYGVKVPLVANVSVYFDFEIKAVKGSK